MLLRMTDPAFFAYAYLYYIKAPDLPFGPPEHRRLMLFRSSLHYFVQLIFFYIGIMHEPVEEPDCAERKYPHPVQAFSLSPPYRFLIGISLPPL